MQKSSGATIVIFGASGDLTFRKLVPALYALRVQGLLDPSMSLVGTGRSYYSQEAYRERLAEGIKLYSGEDHIDLEELNDFLQATSYQSLDSLNPDDFTNLANHLKGKRVNTHLPDNYLFYLATPPSLFRTIAKNLHFAGLSSSVNGFSRIIIEKPFGTNLATALELNQELHQYFQEDQIYRIDHYLGKETVQNLLVSRFANGIFEPLWNRNYIEHVEITAAESLGVENRGGYYDHAGAMRDMVQNHILQMVGLTAMEPPASMAADSIRNEVNKVMQSLRPINLQEIGQQVIRGQYLSSQIRGQHAKGYREEKGVGPDSRTETFVAIKFFIDNWRWGGVPFYIRTGKCLPTRVTEIVIHFKPTPHQLFLDDPTCSSGNQLIIRIQPDEGILLKFGMKLPGSGFTVHPVNMDFHYTDLKKVRVPLAYERLLLDALNGDATLYARADTTEAAWRFIDPIQQAWDNDSSLPIFGYPAGTWGPENADSLIDGKDHTWRYPCKNLADDGEYCEL